jgi:hypothetical protein
VGWGVTAHAWLDLIGGAGLFAAVAASIIACMRANHWEKLAGFHEMRCRETTERAEDRERDEWQNGFREGWQDAHEARRARNDNGGA